MDASELVDACRLCLDRENVSMPIFEGEGVERELYHKIGSCLPVKVRCLSDSFRYLCTLFSPLQMKLPHGLCISLSYC